VAKPTSWSSSNKSLGRHLIEDLDDAAFQVAWLALTQEERNEIDSPERQTAIKRYRRLTKYVGDSIEKVRRAQTQREAASKKNETPAISLSQMSPAAPDFPSPAEESIDGASLLDSVYSYLGRFISYPSMDAHVAHTLWVAHTHAMDCFESTPRIAFLSPEPGSGKTRSQEVTETLVPRPVEAINATPAYLFRKVSDPAGPPTILFDEIDTIFGPRAKDHEEVRGMLNAGHRRGAMAGRCVVRGKLIETEELPAYCAVAVSGLGNLPDSLLQRSVVIRMRRRAPNEVVEPYRRRIHAPLGNKLRDRLATWAMQRREALGRIPEMPPGLSDRNADVWEALLAVADAAGGEWPDMARSAAVALVAASRTGSPSLGIRLLADLRRVFGDTETMATWKIIDALVKLDEAPWGDLKGKPIDSRRLANLLRPYGVSSKTVRDGETTPKGYAKADLHDPWLRYLPPTDELSMPENSSSGQNEDVAR